MDFLRLASAVFLLICFWAPQASAWEYIEIKDEMRGTSAWHALTDAQAPGAATLSLRVIDGSAEKQGALFTVSGDRIRCNDYCQLNVRFGSGSVHEEMFNVDSTGTKLIPSEMPAFIGSVILSDVLFIEVPLIAGGTTQYKMGTAGLRFSRHIKPSFDFAGVALGGGPETISKSLHKAANVPSTLECYEGKDVRDVLDGVSIPSMSMCFYKGGLYSLVLNVSSKKERLAVSNILTKSFGRPEESTYAARWPHSTDKKISLNTTQAAFLKLGKGADEGMFMVQDKALDNIAPTK